MRHGRAVMPWGKYRSVRIRLLPDAYLSWLTTATMLREPRWNWLWQSVISELKFRGMKAELAETADPVALEMLEAERKFRPAGSE